MNSRVRWTWKQETLSAAIAIYCAEGDAPAQYDFHMSNEAAPADAQRLCNQFNREQVPGKEF